MQKYEVTKMFGKKSGFFVKHMNWTFWVSSFKDSIKQHLSINIFFLEKPSCCQPAIIFSLKAAFFVQQRK